MILTKRSAYRTCKMINVIHWQAKRCFVNTYFPQGLQQEKNPDPSNFSRSVPHDTSLNATPQKQAESVQRHGRRIIMHKIRWLHRHWNQLNDTRTTYLAEHEVGRVGMTLNGTPGHRSALSSSEEPHRRPHKAEVLSDCNEPAFCTHKKPVLFGLHISG